MTLSFLRRLSYGYPMDILWLSYGKGCSCARVWPLSGRGCALLKCDFYLFLRKFSFFFNYFIKICTVLLHNSKIFRIFVCKIKNVFHMPTLFIVFGFRFMFYSNDHEPIHVHVIKGNAEARFQVQPDIVLLDNNGLKPAELKLAESLVEENKEMIIERWKAFFA